MTSIEMNKQEVRDRIVYLRRRATELREARERLTALYANSTHLLAVAWRVKDAGRILDDAATAISQELGELWRRHDQFCECFPSLLQSAEDERRRERVKAQDREEPEPDRFDLGWRAMHEEME